MKKLNGLKRDLKKVLKDTTKSEEELIAKATEVFEAATYNEQIDLILTFEGWQVKRDASLAYYIESPKLDQVRTVFKALAITSDFVEPLKNPEHNAYLIYILITSDQDYDQEYASIKANDFRCYSKYYLMGLLNDPKISNQEKKKLVVSNYQLLFHTSLRSQDHKNKLVTEFENSDIYSIWIVALCSFVNFSFDDVVDILKQIKTKIEKDPNEELDKYFVSLDQHGVAGADKPGSIAFPSLEKFLSENYLANKTTKLREQINSGELSIITKEYWIRLKNKYVR